MVKKKKKKKPREPSNKWYMVIHNHSCEVCAREWNNIDRFYTVTRLFGWRRWRWFMAFDHAGGVQSAFSFEFRCHHSKEHVERANWSVVVACPSSLSFSAIETIGKWSIRWLVCSRSGKLDCFHLNETDESDQTCTHPSIHSFRCTIA